MRSAMSTFSEEVSGSDSTGTLFIVATPIGNLGDMTHRAIEVLAEVDWIAAEDTRHSQKLLQHLTIKNKLISLHDHNETARVEQLLARLQKGENGALISDAGTPLINDPGFHLVKRLRAEQIKVVPVPGPSAVITALCAAGLPTDQFKYVGFLPAKQQKKQQALSVINAETATLVFYESPHRLLDTLEAMLNVFGEREMVVARELTKQYEQFVSGSITEVLTYFEQNSEKVRGEFVLMVMGEVNQDEQEASDWDELIGVMLKQSLPVKQISEMVADFYGVKKKVVYERVLKLKET